MMCTDAVCTRGSPGRIGWLHVAQWSPCLALWLALSTTRTTQPWRWRQRADPRDYWANLAWRPLCGS